jgi:hypothetical protein
MRAVEIARGYVGYLEHATEELLGVFTANPGKGGYTVFSEIVRKHYRRRNFQGLPWCAVFVFAVFLEAMGKDAETLLGKPHPGTKVLARRFRRKKRLRDRSYRPKAGDIIFLSNFQNQVIGHVGIVTGTDEKMVYSIEGNTIDPSGVFKREDGGAVAIRGREYNDPAIVCYGEIWEGSGKDD